MKLENHSHKETLCVDNSFFGKCGDQKHHNFRRPVYLVQLASMQVTVWPTKAMACKGRELIESFAVDKKNKKVMRKLKGKNELTMKEKNELAECKDYFKYRNVARTDMGVQMAEMKHVIFKKTYQDKKYIVHPDIRHYQTQVTHCVFIDDPQIEMSSNIRNTLMPPIRSEFSMSMDVFCNLTTPTTIYYGVEYFSTGMHFQAEPIGIACSHLLTGSGALLLRKYKKGRAQSMDRAICVRGLRSYEYTRLLNNWISELDTNERESIMNKFKMAEEKDPVGGNAYYQGNKENKNLEAITETVNNWLIKQRNIFKNNSNLSEEEWKQFETELDEGELMELKSFKLMISERVKQWDKEIPTLPVGDPRTRHTDLLETHYSAIVKHYWESQQVQMRDDSSDPTITTSEQEIKEETESDTSMDERERDSALTQASQSASRRRIRNARRQRQQQQHNGLCLELYMKSAVVYF